MKKMLLLPLALISLSILLLSPQQAKAQSTEELMNSGSEMLQRGAFSQAVTSFRQVLSREPRNFEAQYNLAFAYLGWGRNSNAVDEFKKALALQPKNTHAWANMAIAYENMGKSAEALDALSKAVQADPKNVTARVNLASKYANSGKLTQAINEYNSLVKMGHTQPEVLVNLAKCLITAKRVDEAKKYLREALSADPQNVEARWEMAHIFWKNEKNTAKAKEELRMAIAANAEVASLYEGMASILEEEGNKKEAVENLNRAKIYSSEALVKERIQAWIDKLEGRAAGLPAGSEAQTQMGGMQTLKREDEKPRTQTKTATTATKPVKVDMGGLLDEDDNAAAKDPFGDIGKKK